MPDEAEVGTAVAILEDAIEVARLEDQQIVAQMTGQVIKQYVYQFRQDGCLVEGLTIQGINDAASRHGHIDSSEVVKCEERETSWIAIVKAVDLQSGRATIGACE